MSLLLIGQAVAQTAPSISSIYPTSGRVGASATLTGRQFRNENTIVFGKVLITHVGIASAIGIACTTDPNCRPGIVQTLKFKVPALGAAGPTKVSVKNANGTSNAVDFTVMK